jgi:hypothetical protein
MLCVDGCLVTSPLINRTQDHLLSSTFHPRHIINDRTNQQKLHCATLTSQTTNMAPSPYERTLRTIAMVAAAPGFILTLAGGICISRMNWWNHYNIATPYFAMIPLFLTVATGVVHRRGNSNPDSSSEIINALRTTFWLMADLCLALGYLAVLLPIWIIEPGRLRGYRSGGPLIVVVYGTCFLLTNM